MVAVEIRFLPTLDGTRKEGAKVASLLGLHKSHHRSTHGFFSRTLRRLFLGLVPSPTVFSRIRLKHWMQNLPSFPAISSDWFPHSTLAVKHQQQRHPTPSIYKTWHRFQAHRNVFSTRRESCTNFGMRV
jgi:hypothetical protein